MSSIQLYLTVSLLCICLLPGSIHRNANRSSPGKERQARQTQSDFKYELDTIASSLEKPWAVCFLPDGDILFTERHGQLKRISASTGKVEIVEGLPEIAVAGQGGLLDLILHPDFRNNSTLYLSYSKKSGEYYTTAISRAKLSGGNLVQVREIFEARPAFPSSHHFGSRMAFRDGYLFFSVGDRGQSDQAQMLDRHNGKIMRLAEDGSIPPDNPFTKVAGALPEIWTYGHRNPQGLKFNPVSGELWSHEHGPKGGDELNIIRKGANYGWPEITYGVDYDGSIISPFTSKEGMEQPVKYWLPSIAPCGMAFCRSELYAPWKDNLFIGGLSSRGLFRLQLDGNKITAEEKLFSGIGRVRNVALSPDGFIYFSTEDPGYIFRIIPSPGR